MKKRLILSAAALAAAFGMSTVCYAKDVTFTLETPQDFDERVEVYVDRIEHPMFSGYYQFTLDLEEGKHDLTILSSTDVIDRYEFAYPDSFDTADTDNITISVTDVYAQDIAEHTDEATPGNDGFTDTDGDAMLQPEAAVYDFSEGDACGMMHISCMDYPIFESLTFSLQGDQLYEIVLDREHGSSADISLPVGSYYESTDISYTLSDWAADLDLEQVTLAWQHGGKLGIYGDYYDITPDTPQSLTDLCVYMIDNGKLVEINTDSLMKAASIDEQIAAKNEHNLKELQEAFPDEFPEPATISQAEPIETDHSKMIAEITAKAAIAAIAILGIFGLVFVIKKKKS